MDLKPCFQASTEYYGKFHTFFLITHNYAKAAKSQLSSSIQIKVIQNMYYASKYY